jgi:hypothetical protein
MDYRITNNIIAITDAIADLLRGDRKIHVEAPFTDDDRIISVVDKDFEAE